MNTANYGPGTVSAAEIASVCAELAKAPTPTELRQRLIVCGLPICVDPFDRGPVDMAIHALRERRPLSIIRMGEGEAVALTFGDNPDTPHLDRYLVAHLVSNQADRFELTEPWFEKIHAHMLAAACDADVLGLRGLLDQTTDQRAAMEAAVAKLVRPAIGELRCGERVATLAEAGKLKASSIASAHLYLAVIKHIRDLLSAAHRLLIISTENEVAGVLRRVRPNIELEFVSVGADNKGQSPEFLDRVARVLDRDLSGWLCLIGAGPWAKFYCTWAKHAGAVAIDVGSGLDILNGKLTRPTHRLLGARLDSLRIT